MRTDFNDKISEIAKRIYAAKSVSVYIHVNPDGDAIGSGVALTYALQKLGKKAALFCEDPVPSKYTALPHWELVEKPSKNVFDLAIAVDCPSIERIGNSMKSFLSAKDQIAIDHHKSHQKFANLTLVSAESAAAGEIIFELLSKMKLVDKTVAELLFAAIVTDTGCFQFSNTTENTHQIACKLLEYGIEQDKIIYNVFKRTTQNVFSLRQRVLAKCKFYEDGQIGIITFFKKDFDETNTVSSDTEGIVTDVINVDSVKAAFAVSEAEGMSWKVSIRTKNGVDASDCAAAFGGGGHSAAAGCRISGYYEDIIEKLLKVAKDRL